MTERRLSKAEFVALTAMLFASIAFSVDTMLPGLPHIGEELSPLNPNNAQFVVTSFVLGMGIGTLIVGPISDSYGRKPVILTGAAIYCLASYGSYAAPTMDILVTSRIIMGIAAAAPRAVGLAIVRDLYSGRQMAQIMSFAMLVFSLIPAIAPLFGSFIIEIWGWREIFLGFIAFMLVAAGWLGIRQPETLSRENRTALRFKPIWAGTKELFSNKIVVLAIAVLALNFGMLFAVLVSVQPIYDITFDRGEEFPWWFALTSILAMSGALLNARYVVAIGMRPIVKVSMILQMLFSAVMAILFGFDLLPGAIAFPAFFIWATSIFLMMGTTIGNLNALALEPMGHIAGLASSVVSATATTLSILVAIPIGLAFDGTPLPVMVGVFVAATCAYLLMRLAED